ncbi:hypothetical protein DY000_02006854 [Brassica cretica]|uniref:DUF1985 domain-containing protein n=1 Tax=Brassica cretica TaxID=69181 RepID=A0ABQ7C5A3_BRACR|nr:hypothetical protein DY000_02006854 [Brassica cretica]
MEITLTSTINSPTSPQASNHWRIKIVAKAEVHIVEKADDKVVERVEIQAVKKVEEKVVKRVGHKAETLINENAGQKLKEVELEETPKVEQSPYDKLSFPGRFITKANKVISKFRTYMSDAGVKLPEITNMHDTYVQMMFIKYILSNREEVAELPDISTSKIDPPIGACTILIDLTVFDMMTKRRVPLILGTPFLDIVGACIDFSNKTEILHNVNNTISCPIKSPMMTFEYCGTINFE